jgi:hypothetical protein
MLENSIELALKFYKKHYGKFDTYKVLDYEKTNYTHLENYSSLTIEIIDFLFFGFRSIKTLKIEISLDNDVLKFEVR